MYVVGRGGGKGSTTMNESCWSAVRTPLIGDTTTVIQL